MNVKIYCKKNFGEVRARKGFSMRMLADTTGLNPACISRLENGGPAFPATAKKICEALECGFDEIFQTTKEVV